MKQKKHNSAMKTTYKRKHGTNESYPKRLIK